ncbi:MAG: DegT/DnrJ/EryC1/StrS family aminotransferase [Lachnospiraceae bacterium]|nr:DegT/DnrJ/EryC1/StrS family aminotransferase [Lachnospiraceae bacterium]
MKTIPFLDINRQYKSIQSEAEKSVLEVMRSGHYVEGECVGGFEDAIAQYIDVKHAITCNSGTDALRIALQATGVQAGDEVITTPFSFFATAEAIAQIGAVPVFADIREQSLNIDPDQIEGVITDKTKAILPVHIFGLPADMDEINNISDRHGIPVIEDACQAIGASYNGRKAGSLGRMGCFSFYPTKNLGAFGDGGMITTDDDSLATIIRAYKNHGAGRNGAEAFEYLSGESIRSIETASQTPDGLYDPYKYYNYLIGGNSRLDAMQTAVLGVKLKHLDEYNSRRTDIAHAYLNAFEELPVTLPQTEYTDRTSCWHQFVLLTDRKAELTSYLSDKGIGTGNFYPVPLHLQKAFKGLGYKEGDLPIAENVCKKCICLPVFPELTDDEVNYVAECVREYYGK